MLRVVLPLSLALASPLPAQPAPAKLEATPAAQSLFERDWVLMNWALKHYDGDRDQLMSADEIRSAAAAFRTIADGDRDGRVSPQEFRAARDFILARN